MNVFVDKVSYGMDIRVLVRELKGGKIPHGDDLADSVDSRLVFNGSHVPAYIKLDSKTFPRIAELTISFWIRIWSKIDSLQHTILFYKTGFSITFSI